MSTSARYFWGTVVVVFACSAAYLCFHMWAHEQIFDINRVNWQLKNDVTQNPPADFPDQIIIGDSRTIELDPLYIEQLTGDRMYNLSSGGASMVYYYYAIKRLLDRGVPLTKAYINFTEVNESNYQFDQMYGALFLRYFATKEEAKELEQHVPGTVDYWRTSRFLRENYFAKDVRETLLDPKLRGRVLNPQNHNETLKNTQIHHRGYRIRQRNYKLEQEVDGVTIYDFSDATRHVKPKDGWPKAQPHDLRVAGIYLDKLLTLLNENEVDYTFFWSPIPTRKAEGANNMNLANYPEILKRIPEDQMVSHALVLDHTQFHDWKHTNYPGARTFTEYFSEVVVGGQTPNNYETKILQTR